MQVGGVHSKRRLVKNGEVDARDPSNKVSTDNFRVNDADRETAFRSMKIGVKRADERVLSLRTENVALQDLLS